MEHIDVKMKDVEGVSALANTIQHEHVVWNGIPNARIQPQGLRNTRHQLSGRHVRCRHKA